MPKCLECGRVESNLQWTHFKYKCTGRFNNGKEYRKVYPNADLIDKELRKQYAITLNSLCKKYGQEEGQQRWDSYRAKQAKTNTFEYKKEKYGWNQKTFDAYNKSRASTIENFIARHGEAEGIQKWQEYCDRQTFTKSQEYYLEKYGPELGKEKYKHVLQQRASATNITSISQRYNISLEDAKQLLVTRTLCSAHHGSKPELEFVLLLENQIGPLEHTNKNNPFSLTDPIKNSAKIYDIKHNNCIIEFNGDYWHANPKFYKADDKIRGKLASTIWNDDERKLDLAKKAGYNVMIIWESDYQMNKSEIINKVCKWIQSFKK